MICRWNSQFYICSLSSKTLVYKGLIMAHQLESFYHDLGSERMVTSFALVHSRFSTKHAGGVEAGASVQVHYPQRRDQHSAGEHQLDDRPREESPVRPAGRRREQADAYRYSTAERHGNARQRGRDVACVRTLARTFDDDADSGGLGRPHPDGRSQTGLLRVPLLHDGAVGRPGASDRYATARRSARCSTATASDHAATWLRRTTS